MKVFIVLSVVICLANVQALIVPNELPTILSIIYSNIPTIKKGTDSRLGWGFRLGEHADFQVLVELGPQQYTQKLGNQIDTNRKRNAANTLSNELYAKRQEEKRQKTKVPAKLDSDAGGTWLQQWSQNFRKTQEQAIPVKESSAKPGLALGEIDAKSVIPPDNESTSALEELYKQTKVTTTTSTPPSSTTSKKEALDNVSLDDDEE